MTSLNRGEVPNCCSFNDVQNAMPQKIWSVSISECMRFFSCLHCHRTDPICVTYEQKNRNWVTFNWQCKRGLCHVTHKSKEVCSTWRPISAWHQSTARESIRRRPLSYSSRGTLMTHSDRSSSAASSRTHLSSLQRKHQVGTLQCCQVHGLPPKCDI